MFTIDYKKLSIILVIIIFGFIIFYAIFDKTKKNELNDSKKKIDSLSRYNKELVTNIKNRDIKIDSIEKVILYREERISEIDRKVSLIDRSLSKFFIDNKKNKELIEKYKDSLNNIKYVDKTDDELLESLKNNLRKNAK